MLRVEYLSMYRENLFDRVHFRRSSIVMPRKKCYWTRKLELDLVNYVRDREVIWKPFGNTNHHIKQKYRAYAEFAAKLGRGITARSVRDRWVNIRSTFNHNLRKVEKSKETAQSASDLFVPCWPLWKPLQFLREVSKREDSSHYEGYTSIQPDGTATSSNKGVKEEMQSDVDDLELLEIRQRGHRTDRPRRRIKTIHETDKPANCRRVLDDLLQAMAPFTSNTDIPYQQYWFFGRHVTERLNAMRGIDAECACKEILKILNSSDEDNMKIEND